jgi:hypothetical protein
VPGGGDDRDRLDTADVEIGAGFRAASLRVRTRPEVDVVVHGEAIVPEGWSPLLTVSVSRRENLPRAATEP